MGNRLEVSSINRVVTVGFFRFVWSVRKVKVSVALFSGLGLYVIFVFVNVKEVLSLCFVVFSGSLEFVFFFFSYRVLGYLVFWFFRLRLGFFILVDDNNE